MPIKVGDLVRFTNKHLKENKRTRKRHIKKIDQETKELVSVSETDFKRFKNFKAKNKVMRVVALEQPRLVCEWWRARERYRRKTKIFPHGQINPSTGKLEDAVYKGINIFNFYQIATLDVMDECGILLGLKPRRLEVDVSLLRIVRKA